jgi:isoquinoline 1-oxidoreductase beta subunit
MSKWTRRAFLTTSAVAGGGVLIGVAMRPGNQVNDLAAKVGTEGGKLVHTYVKIGEDNVVTAMIPHSEMGQGVHTALGQMLAEELEADWDQVNVEEAPALGEYANYSLGRTYLLTGIDFPKILIPSIDGAMMGVADSLDMQITGGSMSVRTSGILSMRVAGAATREMLERAAAEAWGVPVAEVMAEKSYLVHGRSSRKEPFSAFVNEVAAMTPSYTPAFKKPEDYKIVGQFVPRRDIPSKVDGSAKFAMDVNLPGMLYATVLRSPVPGGTVVNLEDKDARNVPGVHDVLVIPSASYSTMVGGFTAGETVAVVADSYWSASKALRQVNVQWSEVGYETVSSETIFSQFDKDISAGTERQGDVSLGDADAIFAGAAKVIDADYNVPFLAHTCMEPLNATADVRDGQAEIWVGCQNPLGFRRAVADSLGLDSEKVTLHNHVMGGGFGRKSVPDYALQVAHISSVVGVPVQLIWSREEDVRQDFYRPAVKSRFRAAFDQDDNLIGWSNTYTNKNEPVEAPLIPYSVPTQDIGYVSSPTHVPFGAWRSVDHSQHGFFTESFIDEAAHAAKKDPFEFRANLLNNKPRLLAVLSKVADEAQWSDPLPEGRGRGISLQESFGSIVAQVVEVTVTNGKIAVDRVVAAIDPGLAVAPDGLSAQIESGIIYGLTAAMYGEISIEDGAVVQGNFNDYESIRMDDSPIIETHIINSGHDIGGAGEPGTPGIAPAVANAVFDATGIRVRLLPLNNFDLNYLVEEDGVAS